MNILLWWLFLFQMIPILLKANYFIELNKIISKFVWDGKCPRIKMKLLKDVRQRVGLGVPNWQNYYKACALIWIREWIILEDRRLLKFEGRDLTLGWHAYFWYDKAKGHRYFNNHNLRNALLKVWDSVKYRIYGKISNWVSPMEAFSHPNILESKNIIRYAELLTEEGKLKMKETLEQQNYKLDWWSVVQIESGYAKDKSQEFYVDKTEFDKLLLDSNKKLIKKMYKWLLELRMEDQVVKECMIKWVQNLGYIIELDQWHKIWNSNIKMTKSTNFF